MKKKRHNKISIFQWNCRSINSNFHEFEHHIENKNYSVLALQSLNVDPLNLPNLKHYYYPPLYSQNMNSDKVMTALYIRSDLEYTEYKISLQAESKLISLQSIDGLYYTGATIKFKNQLLSNILSIYYPKGPKDDNTDWIKNVFVHNKHHIILGDFNARSPMWDVNCKITTSSRFVENIINSKFLLLNTGEVTRVPDIINHRPSALDLSLVSPSLATSCLWNLLDDSLGSDHIPICLEINRDFVNYEKVDEGIIPKFKYKLANWDLFNQTMSMINEKEIANDDINIFFENFKNAIISAAKLSIPQRKINKTQKKSKEWWNPKVEKIVNDKKYAFKEYIKDQDSDDKFFNMKSLNKEAKKAVNDARLEDFVEFVKKRSRNLKICTKFMIRLILLKTMLLDYNLFLLLLKITIFLVLLKKLKPLLPSLQKIAVKKIYLMMLKDIGLNKNKKIPSKNHYQTITIF